MKIDRRKFLAASSSALVLAKSQLSSAASVPWSETSENLAIAERIEGREVKVYTPDDNSNHRLAATKTFQTILGSADSILNVGSLGP